MSGLSAGGDLRVAFQVSHLLADLLRPGVTVVAQDPLRIGQMAASLLFRRIRGEGGPAEQMIISTDLRSRGSGEITVS